MSPFQNEFEEVRNLSRTVSISIANGRKVFATGVGTVRVMLKKGGSIRIDDVLLVPDPTWIDAFSRFQHWWRKDLKPFSMTFRARSSEMGTLSRPPFAKATSMCSTVRPLSNEPKKKHRTWLQKIPTCGMRERGMFH